ncbi:hypothetical protein [Streptomyces sp. SID4985]|uniref:hypothetical protein n=1 Tax=unclassified Streptomyces TaxID=2593676 RepID=UPI001926135E|nr:hypothetical protein [Streptomyces sp. SID4985]
MRNVISSVRRAALVTGAGTLTLLGGLAWTAAADGEPHTADAAQPPYAVEDFAYPGADAIKVQKGIELKRGDGHIVLVDCDPAADQIRVLTVKDSSVGRQDTYCFKATAKSGFLTMQLPRVFGLEAADHPISADLTAAGTTTTVDVEKDGFKSVGEGTVGGAQSVLVEIRVTG